MVTEGVVSAAVTPGGVTAVTCILVVLCCLLGARHLRQRHQYWQRRGVACPSAPPLLGHTLARMGLTRPFTEFFEELYYNYNGRDYCGFYDFLKPGLFVGNPQLIKSILVQDFQFFADRRTFDLAKVSPVANDMLTNAKGTHWRRVRTAVSPAFTKTRTRRLYPLLLQRARHLLRLVRSLTPTNGVSSAPTVTHKDTSATEKTSLTTTIHDDTEENLDSSAPQERGQHINTTAAAAHTRHSHAPEHTQDTIINSMVRGTEGSHIPTTPQQHEHTHSSSSTTATTRNQATATQTNDQKINKEELKRKDDIEARRVCGRYTMDAIASCAFGLECEALDSEAALFPIMAARVFQLSPIRALKMLLVAVSPRAAQMASAAGLRYTSPEFTFFMRVAKHALAARRAAHAPRGDFLDLLLEAAAQSKQGLSDDTLAAQAILFLLAGYDNTANTFAMCLHLLAHHPPARARLRRELAAALLRSGGTLSYEEVTELPYLDAVVSETLRLYPAAPVIERVCTEPCRLGGVEVEVGTAVIVPVWCLHRDPEHWPRPQQFLPERFLGAARQTHTPFTYLPFGAGPRSCVGVRFAQVTVKVGLMALLSAMDVLPSPASAYPAILDPRVLTLQPKDGLYISLKPTPLPTLLQRELEEHPPTCPEDERVAADLRQMLESHSRNGAHLDLTE